MLRDFFHTPPCTMIAAAPQTVPPRRIRNKQFKKPLPAVLRRGPEAGFHRIYYDFHGLGANHIDSCPFQQSQNIQKNRIFFCGLVYIQLNAKMPCVQVV